MAQLNMMDGTNITPLDFPPPASIRANPDYVPGYIEQPAAWSYAIDPATGNSRANYPGAAAYTKAAAAGVTVTPIGMYDPAPPAPTPWRANVLSQVDTAQVGGSNTDATTSAILGVTTVYGAPNSYYWGVTGLANYHGTGGTGQMVALIGYATRYTAGVQPTTTVAVTLGAPSVNVQVADVTNFQVPYPLPIVINGHSYLQNGVSGTSGAGTITLASPVTVADGTSGNTVTGCNNPQMWAANLSYSDQTGLDSQHSGIGVGLELDYYCNGLDNGPTYGGQQGSRAIMSMLAMQANTGGTAAQIAAAIHTWTAANVVFKAILVLDGTYTVAAVDVRGAVQQSGNAIWLAQGQAVAFDSAANASMAGTGTQVLLKGTQNDPLILQTPAGNYCRLYLEGARNWSVGVLATTGVFAIGDETGGGGRLSIDTAGNVIVDNATAALTIGGTGGPTWTTGSAAPASTQPVGSLYSRVGGAVGATLYVSRGGGTWNPVSGV